MTFRYDVIYDDEYLKKPGVQPRGPIQIPEQDPQGLEVVKDYLSRQWQGLIRPPVGALKHPYLVPGATYTELWDWDSFFTACSLPDEAWRHGQGCIRILLDGVREDGRPAKKGLPSGGYDYGGHPIPIQAQFAYVMAKGLGEFAWVQPYWPALETIRRWYEQQTVARGRYFVWLGFRGNGLDNNPSVYGRPAGSSAGIDLACWHYRENLAMARLADALGKGDGEVYRGKAAELGELIRSRYWDTIDRLFYAVDCLADERQRSLQGIGWEVFLKFRSWASLFPMWAGVADAEQAAALREKILDPAEFLSPAGVRSHSALDPVYNNTASGNPSNWQGPVWTLSTFLTAYGLARCGYQQDALDLCDRMVRVLAADVRANGCLHEFYHGDSGQPLLRPGFLSWNLLALRTVDDIRAGRDVTSQDLLDG